LGEFLRAHREAAHPTSNQRRRRTPGLRREEVAARAAISTDYYTRLEQGRERSPSAQVLDALADALELSAAETGYLHSLIAPAKTVPAEGPTNEFLVLVMQSWSYGPAYIVNHRSDVLAANVLAQNIFEPFGISDNILRMLFLDPASRQRWVDWEAFATFVVGSIRRLIGPALDADPATAALIAEVGAQSPVFTQMWERQAMQVPDRKAKTFRDDDLGDLKLDFELLTAVDTPNQILLVHRTAQVGRVP
jgi:transcriptional regulator with XRE-family HTH domain